MPDQPSAPTTAISGDFVEITWVLPGDGSSPVTGFKVEVRQNDGVTFTEEAISCDGTDSVIVAELKC